VVVTSTPASRFRPLKSIPDNGISHDHAFGHHPKVTERGLWDVFRTCGRDDQQGKLWADLALGELKDKKIAIVHDKTTYGQGLADAARVAMNAGGKKEVLYEGVNTGEKDYSAIGLEDQGFGRRLSDVGRPAYRRRLIIRQMRDQGMSTIMISGDGITDNEFASIGGPASKALHVVRSRSPQQSGRQGHCRRVPRQGLRARSLHAVFLRGRAIIKQAAEKANSLDTKKIAEVMHSGMTFKTVLGDIALDKKGDPHERRLCLVCLEERRRRQDHLQAALVSAA